MSRAGLIAVGLGLFLVGNVTGLVVGRLSLEVPTGHRLVGSAGPGGAVALDEPLAQGARGSRGGADHPSSRPATGAAEVPRRVPASRELVRPAFRLRHPATWSVDTAAEDYDPDRQFSIDSAGGCFSMFFLFDEATAAQANVETQTRTLVENVVLDGRVESFERWGRYRGTGRLIEGQILGALPGKVSVFSHSSDSRSFMVVEQCFDEDLERVGPGFEMIESSFQLE